MSASSFNRPGAIDLSKLAKPSQPAPGAPASGAGGRASYVVEVTEQTFDAEVMRKSVQHPVVVEFYSPRVSTGQQLSDTLATLAAEAAGKYLVARLNVDTAPQIVSALGLQAVPTVVAVIGGQIAPLFQGVLPADQVRQYLDELLKAAVANGIVGRAEPVAGSESQPEAEAVPDPRFAAADEALERGDFAAARDEFDKLLQASPGDAEALAGRAQAGLLARTTSLNADEVMARVASPDADIAAHLEAADVELATGQAEAAFSRLLTLVRTRTGDDREAARVRLLELFETLGNADERVLKARRDLMTALY
ncbi:tetratricopeptide repeat protein [Microlunatus panaciterrae]|uniref:Thioredoxin n=1 Tax=Microlunatus panaciterrae TaxID=400768 RepID=A0ABS2REC5_9ACTN|nr:tetratricopeptide repeat protein [Microlunatus panaciterrae]MBM7797354.1 putative thioredoxin [Microlunatus panaciterrae]